MPGFRRAQLRGSDELFRPTRPEGDESGGALAPGVTRPVPPEPAATTSLGNPLGPAAADGRLLRLTDDEITTLADALQRLKFPAQARGGPGKPPVDEFERLEELRQKLLSVL